MVNGLDNAGKIILKDHECQERNSRNMRTPMRFPWPGVSVTFRNGGNTPPSGGASCITFPRGPSGCGEGMDGGERFAHLTPTGYPLGVLPHPGGGEFSLVGFEPTTYERSGSKRVFAQ